MREGIFSGIILGPLFLASCASGPGQVPDNVGLAGIDLAPVTVLNGQPVYNSSANSFCIIDDDKLKVSVVNGGNIPTSTKAVVTVKFITVDGFELVEEPIPAGFAPFILSGAFESLEFNIPGSCFTSDCKFTINVDLDDNVPEIFENNNEVDGKCIG